MKKKSKIKLKKFLKKRNFTEKMARKSRFGNQEILEIPEKDGAVVLYDFTFKRCEKLTSEILKKWLNKIAKKWGFQGETGSTTGYRHYQGRLSLKSDSKTGKGKKTQKAMEKICWNFFDELKIEEWGYIRKTSKNKCEEIKENYENFYDYVNKEETREDGPWRDDDTENAWIPPQCRIIIEMGYRPFQKHIYDDKLIIDYDHINLIVNREGFMGKSKFVLLLEARKEAWRVPNTSSYEHLLEMVCDMNFDVHEHQMFFIDLPRGISGRKMDEFLAAIETIKDGYAYDRRYHFDKKMFASPNIWIFANNMPNLLLVTLKRWRIYDINPETYELEKLDTYEIANKQREEQELLSYANK